MKFFLQKQTLILFLFLAIASFVCAQTSEFKYVVQFEEMEQQQVKPLISLLKPIFPQTPKFIGNTYGVFYYSSDKEVVFEQVSKMLEGSNYKLLSLKAINLDEYNVLFPEVNNN